MELRKLQVAVLFALVAIADSLFCQTAAPQPADVLSWEQAVALASEHNRQVRIAQIEVEKAWDRLAIARSHRLPSLNFTLYGSQLVAPFDFTFRRGAFGTLPTPAGLIPNPPEDSKIRTAARPTGFVFARAAQPISQLYRVGLGIRLQETGVEIGRENLRAQKQAVVNNVRKVFYGALQVQSAREATEEALKLFRELDRIVEQYVEQQVALKSESLEIKTRIAKTEHDIVTLENSLISLKEQLNQLLGRDIRTDFRLGPIPDALPQETDLASAQARALEQRPEIRESRLKVRQAEYDRRMKKAEYIPDVSLAFNHISFISFRILPANINVAGLLVSWNPFDWGRTSRELAEKSRTMEQANLGLREAETLVLLDVSARFRKLQESRALLKVSQMAEETEREKLRVATNRLNQNAALLKDVLQAQAALAEKSHEYRQSLLSFWTARSEFEKALGED